MDIVFSHSGSTMVIPIVPPGIAISDPQDSEEFNGLSRNLTIVGNKGIRSFQLESFFPNKSYPFAAYGSSTDGFQYLDFFERGRKSKVPFRVVITSEGREVANMACIIPSFSWNLDKAGDISYSMEVKEYPFISEL